MPPTLIDHNQNLEGHIEDYLLRCRELTELCSQNGWIDNATIAFDILERQPDHCLIAVTFTEVIMEGSGCVADRIACYGRMRLKLDNNGGAVESGKVV